MNLCLSCPTKNGLLMRIIVGVRAHELSELPRTSNRSTEDIEEELAELSKLVNSVRRKRHFHLCLSFVFWESVNHPFSRDAKGIPHCDQFGDSFPKRVRKIVQTILRTLSRRKWRVKDLGHDPFEILAPNDRTCTGDNRVIKNFDYRTNSDRKHCNLNREQAPENSSHTLSIVNRFLVLLARDVFRFIRNVRCAIRRPLRRQCHSDCSQGRNKTHSDGNPIGKATYIVSEWTKNCHRSSMNRTCILPCHAASWR